MLTLPRFVALDSSHLAGWSRDWTSSRQADFTAAREFEQRLADHGWVPLLCWHHLEELLCHRDPAVAEARFWFLCALPVVGWIATAGGEAGLGSVLDIMAAEAMVTLQQPGATAVEVRDRTRPGLVRVGTGAEAMAPYAGIWRDLQPHFWEREEQNRAVAAITRAKVSDLSSRRVFELLASQLRAPTDLNHQMKAMMEGLTREIRDRGDKRIRDPAAVAATFCRTVVETAAAFPTDARAFVIEGLILKGIEAADIGPETTLGDLDDIGIFRNQLKVAAGTLGLSWPLLKQRVRMEQFPSSIIDRGLRRYGQDLPERKGSEVTDGHLACLAAYADLTFVDKRTKENVRQASSKSPAFSSVVRAVDKAAGYADIVVSA